MLKMSMGMEVAVFLSYAFAVLMVYVFGRFLLIPLKGVLFCVISSLLGGLAIILINYFGSAWGIFVPLNIFTAMFTGVLGIPGIVVLIIFFA